MFFLIEFESFVVFFFLVEFFIEIFLIGFFIEIFLLVESS